VHDRGGLTPAQRSLRSRLAAYSLHAKRDPKETTQAARAAFLTRFEREVDPRWLSTASRACQARPGSAKGAHDSTGFGIVTGEVENNMRTQPVLGSFARGATVDTAKRDTQTPRDAPGHSG
jgi:hypothetical protein